MRFIPSSCAVKFRFYINSQEVFPLPPGRIYLSTQPVVWGSQQLVPPFVQSDLKVEQLRIFTSLLFLLLPCPFLESQKNLPLVFFSIFTSSWCFSELLFSQVLSQPSMIQSPQSVICQRKSMLKCCFINKKQFTYDSRCACAKRS